MTKNTDKYQHSMKNEKWGIIARIRYWWASRWLPKWLAMISFFVDVKRTVIITILLLIGFFIANYFNQEWSYYLLGGIITNWVIADIRPSLTKLIKRVDDIDASIASFGLVDNPAFQHASPLKLTKMGEQIAEDIDADSIVKNHKLAIDSFLKATPRDNAYLLQEKCFEFSRDNLFNHLPDDKKKQIQDIAFKKGWNIDRMMTIIGIKIRDKILANNGLKEDDIDNHKEKVDKK